MIKRALQDHAVFRFITLLLAFGFQITVVKVLTPASYVAYAVLLATLLVGERLLSFGIGRTVLRFVPRLVLMHDRKGIRVLWVRLGLLRIGGLILFVLALTTGSELLRRTTPTGLTTITLFAFGVWFVAFTFLNDATAVAQSLLSHRAAALAAAFEGVVRMGLLTVVWLTTRSINVETVVIISAIASSAAFVALVCSIRLSSPYRKEAGWSDVSAQDGTADIAQTPVLLFTAAAYASTISYVISSPGVIRLVATTGLGVITLAAYSFAQGIAMAMQRALPGLLILPSIEPVAARMVESGRGHEMLPVLSLLFKFELACVLSVIIAVESAGAEIIGLLSRPAYAPYYYILPALMVGLILNTVYRMLEMLGSMNLMYKIFLSMWPLSVVAVVALYFAMRKWGLISVLVVPIAEMVVRVALLIFALRHRGVRQAMDPVRSLRLVASAVMVWFGSSYVLGRVGASVDHAHLLVATAAVGLFLLSLLIIRPLSARECETLSRIVPAPWMFPSYVSRLLSSP